MKTLSHLSAFLPLLLSLVLLSLPGCDVYQVSVTTLDDQGNPERVISGSRSKLLQDSDLQGFTMQSPTGWRIGVDQSATQTKDEVLLRLVDLLESRIPPAP